MNVRATHVPVDNTDLDRWDQPQNVPVNHGYHELAHRLLWAIIIGFVAVAAGLLGFIVGRIG